MKLFGRTGGYYLFWTGAVYLLVGLSCALYYKGIPSQLIQIIWLAALALPFTYPPLGRYFNLDVTWDKNMFDWFNKDKTPSNVVPFPEVPKTPYIVPPSPKKEAETYYSIGITDDHRMSLRMGYSTLTMNREGCQNLIDQLTVFMNQLPGEDDGQSD